MAVAYIIHTKAYFQCRVYINCLLYWTWAYLAKEVIMKHGTINAYTNGKCRCYECKEAKAEYQKKYKGGKTKRTPQPCGTRSMYIKGCRCWECKKATSDYAASLVYSISRETVIALRDIKACDICGTEINTQESKTGNIDHCHRTGQVRGVLCQSCNYMLGHARDSVETLSLAIKYLKRPPFNG